MKSSKIDRLATPDLFSRNSNSIYSIMQTCFTIPLVFSLSVVDNDGGGMYTVYLTYTQEK